MSRAAIIDTPFPSLEETAQALGVPVSQAKRVQRLISEKKNRRPTTTAKRASKYAARKASKRA
jgi:hypothetical protein